MLCGVAVANISGCDVCIACHVVCVTHNIASNIHYIVYLMVSVEQPDDCPIAGPKHVVVIYYIVLFMI